MKFFSRLKDDIEGMDYNLASHRVFTRNLLGGNRRINIYFLIANL